MEGLAKWAASRVTGTCGTDLSKFVCGRKSDPDVECRVIVEKLKSSAIFNECAFLEDRDVCNKRNTGKRGTCSQWVLLDIFAHIRALSSPSLQPDNLKRAIVRTFLSC